MSSTSVPKTSSGAPGCSCEEKFILASAFPRRQELLKTLITQFEVMPSDIDEACLNGETPVKYVRRMAGEKARAVIEGSASLHSGQCWVLAADTSVILGDVILGKPENAEEARWMLRQLQGRRHEVLTGICLLNPGRAIDKVEAIRTGVWMKKISNAEVENYIGTGEPFERGDDGSIAYQQRHRDKNKICREG